MKNNPCFQNNRHIMLQFSFHCFHKIMRSHLQAPQPAEPWEGIRDALKEGDVAPQTGVFQLTSYSGNEDCLFINVFTPKVKGGSTGKMTFLICNIGRYLVETRLACRCMKHWGV